MTPEHKDLLLKDLCARLPYDIKFPITWPDPITSEPIETTGTISDINRYGIVSFVWDYEGQEILQKNDLHIKDVKPYLFPLSSVTDEQSIEYRNLCERYCPASIYSMEIIDWLNKNHFDYRGLIEKGLALDATNLNIY